MSEELKRLIQDVKDNADKASFCCGCNMFGIDNAIEALEEFLRKVDG